MNCKIYYYYYNKIIDDNKDNMKGTLSILNSIIRNKQTKGNYLDYLTENNITITNKNEVVNRFGVIWCLKLSWH